MITLDEVLRLHEKSIQDYGGTSGIRDTNMLESAIARPFQSFDVQSCILLLLKKQPLSWKTLLKIIPLSTAIKEQDFLRALLYYIEIAYLFR